ncbi:hypothetical protein [uncultured Jatrophihabitans sp.]|uniref:hypothetical protein n=1 Tax=uncultured Jatrophihabitans sp. TaxID=1610747 RepID=UPI0035CBC3C9
MIGSTEHADAQLLPYLANQLAGVRAAVGAGQGVAWLATQGQTPEGLIARDDLPAPEPLGLRRVPDRELAKGA